MTGNNRFVEVQGTGEEATFDDQELTQLLTLAKQGIAHLHAKQKESLGKAWPW
jgi:ribonuclease PH